MNIQYVIAGVLILGGFITAWAGPEYGVTEDGTPFTPKQQFWVRIFGITLFIAGLVILAATLMGFRVPPAQDPVGF